MSWYQIGTDIDGSNTGDFSGYSTSISGDGNTVAVGAIFNDGEGNPSNDERGQVRVFSWNGTDWQLKGNPIYGVNNGDLNGNSVSLNGDGSVIAMGAINNDGDGSIDDNRGQVRIFYWNGTDWQLKGSPIYGNTGDKEGTSVSLDYSGNIIATGAIDNDGLSGNSDDNRGQVRIFEWNGTDWQIKGNPIYGNTGDQCGKSVSLSNDGLTVAVSAIYNDADTGNPDDNRGQVRIFYWNNDINDWSIKGDSIYGLYPGDLNGISISLNATGNRIAIGAIGGGSNLIGYVRVFEWDTSNWNLMDAPIFGQNIFDYDGFSVSLCDDGNILAFGAINRNNFRGYVRTCRWNGTNWQIIGNIDGEEEGDYSGWAVSISSSSNNTRLVVGSPFNDGTTGNILDDRGHVRVYQLTNILVDITLNNKTGNEFTVCQCDKIKLKANVSGNNGSLNYQWYLNDLNNSISGATCRKYCFKANNIGQFVYIVKVTDNENNVNTDSITVNVIDKLIVKAGKDIRVCFGKHVILKAKGNAEHYTWNKGILDGVAFMPQLGKTRYVVTGSNQFGCKAYDSVNVCCYYCNKCINK